MSSEYAYNSSFAIPVAATASDWATGPALLSQPVFPFIAQPAYFECDPAGQHQHQLVQGMFVEESSPWQGLVDTYHQ